MSHDDVGRRARILVQIAVILLLGLVWWALARAEVWSRVILPGPGQVWHAFVQSVTTEGRRRGLSGSFLWEHLWASLWRILRGLFWALLFGLPLGLALASSRWFRAAVAPPVDFLRALPPLGYFSLLMIWFGIDDTSKVWLLFLAAFPPITLSVAAGTRRVRTDRIEAARSLGASRRQVFVHTIVPSVLPDLFTGLRLATGFAWTTIVAAETSNGLPGIGGLAWATKKELRTDVAILCVIVIGITAVTLDQLIQLLERTLAPWRAQV